MQDHADYPLTAIQKILLRRMDTKALKPENEYLRSMFVTSAPVDLAALTKAFEELAVIHDALRTSVFRHGERDAQSFQRLHADARPDILLVTSTPERPIASQDDAVDIAHEMAYREFSSDSRSLARFLVISLDDGKTMFGFVTHHLISDAVAHSILRADLTELYKKHLGADYSLAAQTASYEDFVNERAAWDRNWRESPDAFHWQGEVRPNKPLPAAAERPSDDQKLRVAPPVVQLGTDKAHLGSLAKGYKATPFVIMLTALCLACFRLVKSRSVLLGVVGDERGGKFQRVVGCFASVYHLFIEMPDDDASFEDLVPIVREKYFGMFKRPWVPESYLVGIEKVLSSSEANGIYIVDYMEGQMEGKAAMLGMDTDEVRVQPSEAMVSNEVSSGLEPVVFFMWNGDSRISGIVSGETDPGFPYTNYILKAADDIIQSLSM